MIDLYFKPIWWTILFFITFSTKKCLTLTICPTAVWLTNATTVAGSITGILGSTPYTLTYPTDVYIDKNNTMYVLDAGNYRVQRFLSNSTAGTTVINSNTGTELDQFGSMVAMSIDDDGSIYILDSYNARVIKWIQGAVTGILVAGVSPFEFSTMQMNRPSGMFIDLNTSVIWIADTYNHRIVKWPSPETSEVICGSYGSKDDQFIYPNGLFVDTTDSNTLYVADSGNHRIQMWLPGASSGITVAGITNYYGNGLNQLSWPQTLIVDTNRNMFIVDTNNGRIMKWTIGSSSGVSITGQTTSDIQQNDLWMPEAISFDSNGSLFVVDEVRNRIQKYVITYPVVSNISTTTASSVTTETTVSNITCSITTWSSNATTVAGSQIGRTDNISVFLDTPTDVFVDKNSAIYVLDSGNYRVQLFLPNSTIGITIIQADISVEIVEFISMDAMSIDLNGNIYILDKEYPRVTLWTPGATSGIIVAGGDDNADSDDQLRSPYGMFVELNTSIIWIADTGNSRIVKWINPSTSITVCGVYGSQANQFKYPQGLFVDTSSSNTLYVADSDNHRIQMWLPGATNGTTVAGQTGIPLNGLNQLAYPQTLIVDTNDVMYIVDNGNQRIMRWIIGSTSGVIVAGSSTYGNLPNQLYYPRSVRLDPIGDLIVADTSNHRIQKFSVSCVPYIGTTQTTTSTIGITSNVPSTIDFTSSSSTLFTNSSTISTSTSTSTSITTYYPRLSLIIFCSIIILMNN